MSTATKLTYDDYLGFPDDGKRHEIVDGEHFVTPAPNVQHQAIVRYLIWKLESRLRAGGLGWLGISPLDVVLGESDIVQPDLLYVAAERLAIVEKAHVAGPPDLVIEVVSESTRRHDEMTKRQLYAKHGVAEYWVVDPVIEVVKVYRLGEQGYERPHELAAERAERLSSPFIPDLEIPLDELFTQR